MVIFTHCASCGMQFDAEPLLLPIDAVCPACGSDSLIEQEEVTVALAYCPRCDAGDLSEGATAVHDTYHLEHVHSKDEPWENRHRHMFYAPHTHPAN